MKRIWVSIPEATEIKYVVLDQLRGFVLVNRLAAQNSRREPLRLRSVNEAIITWLKVQYADQQMKARRAQKDLDRAAGTAWI